MSHDLTRPSDTVVRITEPAPRDAWEAVFASSTETYATQSPSWLDCILSAGAFADASRLFELESGRHLVMPAVRRRWPRTRDGSLPPGWGIGGLIGPGRIRSSDVSTVAAALRSGTGHRVLVKPGPLSATAWRTAMPGSAGAIHAVHMLDLDGGFDRVWMDRIPAGTRQRARHATRCGITVEHGAGSRHVPEFHRLYERWCDERAARSHRPAPLQRWISRLREPPGRVDVVAARLGDAFRTTVVRRDGEAVGAVIVLTLGAVAVGWRYAYDRDRVGHTHATYLLHVAAIEDACAAGCQSYHLGESGGLGRIEQFKEHFGASRLEYPEFWLGPGTGPAA